MKKKLGAILSLLVVLLVSSISMTFAWFAGARELFVDAIELTIDADADILLSLDDNFEHAKSSLSLEDFGEIGGFSPISSMGSEHSDWLNNEDAIYPDFIASYRHTLSKEPPLYIATNGFFQKRLYLFSDRRMYATFDSANTVVQPDVEKNDIVALSKAEKQASTTYLDLAYAKIDELGITNESRKKEIIEETRKEQIDYYHDLYLSQLNSIENSLRISILDRDTLTNSTYTIIDPKKNGSTVFGGRLNTSAKDTYYDYYIDHDTNTYKETLYGDIKTQDHDLVYKPAQTTDILVNGVPSCFNAGTKAGVCALDMEDLSTNVTFYEETSITPEEADVTVSKDETQGYMILLEPYVPHPITLSIYIEGWDLDNTDITQQGSFTMNVAFRLIREAFNV